MEISDKEKSISLKFVKFPQNLLVPSLENAINIQATNYSNKNTYFKFDFEGENLNIDIPDEFKDAVQFNPSENKNIEVKISPTSNGFGKLSVIVSWLKPSEYKVKTKKLRDTILKSQIEKILAKYKVQISDYDNSFKSQEYIISITQDGLKKTIKELEQKQKDYKSIADSPTVPNRNKKELLDEIDNYKKQIARGYLSNKDIENALKYAMVLSETNEKKIFKNNLLRTYATINLEATLNFIKNLPQNNEAVSLIRSIALDEAITNPDEAPKIAFLIQDQSVRQNLIFEIISKTAEKNHDTAVKICTIIDDDLLKVKMLFNIIKILFQKNFKSEIVSLLNQIISIIEKTNKLNLEENNYKNSAYEIYKDAICALAELDSPQAAEVVLTTFNLKTVKDKISEEIFNLLYEMVDEIKSQYESTPTLSQYYLFNTLTSNINEDIKNFSLIGGNISNNITSKNFNFNVLLISLFSYNFSIFPIIDRVYSDLLFNNNKNIAYYIFPSKENHNQSELKTINNTLKQLIASNIGKTPSQVLIFNLDFIPYLGKPTIILSSESDISKYISSKIASLKNSVNTLIDDSFFSGGISYDNLKQLFPSPKYKVVNLVLSYEFLNDYDIFKSFLLSLT
ncbi:MAG TPA: hypothetical protein VGB37_17850 [Candidatus Lokiarchaeia archaeon]